jgi:hypothetical protein
MPVGQYCHVHPCLSGVVGFLGVHVGRWRHHRLLHTGFISLVAPHHIGFPPAYTCQFSAKSPKAQSRPRWQRICPCGFPPARTPPPLVGEVGCLVCVQHALAAACATPTTPRFTPQRILVRRQRPWGAADAPGATSSASQRTSLLSGRSDGLHRYGGHGGHGTADDVYSTWCTRHLRMRALGEGGGGLPGY